MAGGTMSGRLTIGVASLGPGVRILLDQLGLAFEGLARWGDFTPEQYSAVIVNAPLDSAAADAVDRYLKGGGGVIDTGHFLPAVERSKLTRRSIRTVVRPADEAIFRDVWLVDINQSVLAHDDARHLDGLAHLTSWGDGFIAYIPLDVDRILTTPGSARKRFYTPFSRFPNEIVAATSRGEIRGIFERALRWLYEMRGLPYIHRWRFPGTMESIFAYRIDSDYGTREQVMALHQAARRNDIAMTWFAHVEAHRDYLGLFREMEREGAEIGVHCYRHRTFRAFEENSANIAQAASMLMEEGIAVEGYAAPNGFWNDRLAEAIDRNGFNYSSEFSLDYDDLPFTPWTRGAFAHALQVPVHPVCIGSFLRVKGTGDAMKRYFRWTMERKLQEREPIILYHHPGHEKVDVMEDSFRHAGSLGVPNITMGAYARWWRRRSSVRHDISYRDGTLHVSMRRPDPEVRLALRAPDGAIGFIGDEGSWRIDDIAMRPAPERRVEMPADIGRARRLDPLLWRHAIEDFNSRARQ